MPLIMSRLPVPFDIHLVKMPQGSSVPEHTDPFNGRKMYRFNVVLREPEEGGEFKCAESILDWRRIKFFRPDINPHSVTQVTKGERLILSFGICL
jgi:aspartyl/asparaginyl beta-hydroxylase